MTTPATHVDDSSRCSETAAQYCRRYTSAVEQLVKYEDLGSTHGTMPIAFHQSCGQPDQFCWLYGQVIRFLDDDQDDALVQVSAPIHMRYYNAISATLYQQTVATAVVSLKATQARVVSEPFASPYTQHYYCYSYHPAVAEPEKKRKSAEPKHNGNKRRLSAAMVLLSPPPRRPEDVDIDFDQEFAFTTAAEAEDALQLDDYDANNENITEEELRILFHVSSLASPPPCHEDVDDGDDFEDALVRLPPTTVVEHCNDGGDEDDFKSI
jgi:hypothetical protein